MLRKTMVAVCLMLTTCTALSFAAPIFEEQFNYTGNPSTTTWPCKPVTSGSTAYCNGSELYFVDASSAASSWGVDMYSSKISYPLMGMNGFVRFAIKIKANSKKTGSNYGFSHTFYKNTACDSTSSSVARLNVDDKMVRFQRSSNNVYYDSYTIKTDIFNNFHEVIIFITSGTARLIGGDSRGTISVATADRANIFGLATGYSGTYYIDYLVVDGTSAATVTINDGINPINQARIDVKFGDWVFFGVNSNTSGDVTMNNLCPGTTYTITVSAKGYKQVTQNFIADNRNSTKSLGTISLTADAAAPAISGFQSQDSNGNWKDAGQQVDLLTPYCRISAQDTSTGLNLVTKPQYIYSTDSGQTWKGSAGLRGYWRNYYYMYAGSGYAGDLTIWQSTNTTAFAQTSAINIAVGTSAPSGFSTGINYYNAEWVGFIKSSSTSGDYGFYLNSDEGGFIDIGNKKILWDNARHGPGTLRGSTMTLTADTWYPVHLGFFEYSSSATCKFYWTLPGQTTAEATLFPSSNMMYGDCTVTGSNGATGAEYITTPKVGFNQITSTANIVMFAVMDLAGNIASSTHTVQVFMPTGTVSGLVTEQQTGNPVGGAIVKFLGSRFVGTTITAADGTYSLTVPTNTYTMAVRLSSYSAESTVNSVIVNESQNTVQNFTYDLTVPTGWTGIQVTKLSGAWVDATTDTSDDPFPDCRIQVGDIQTGLNTSVAGYMYSKNNGTTWLPSNVDFTTGSSTSSLTSVGTWSYTGGEAKCTTRSSTAAYLAYNVPVSSSIIRVDTQIVNSGGSSSYWTAIHFFQTAKGDAYTKSGYMAYFTNAGNLYLIRANGSNYTNIGSSNTGIPNSTTYHTITVEAIPGKLSVWLDNMLCITSTDTAFKSGYVSLRNYVADGRYDNFKIYSVADIPGTDGVNSSTITAAAVPFGQSSTTNNKIRFITADMYGNFAQSLDYLIKVSVPTGTVSGLVTDVRTSTGVANVTVRALLNSVVKGEATSDADGNYILTLPTGTYTMTAAKQGYYTLTYPGILVNENANTAQSFTINPVTGTVTGTVVSANTGGLLENVGISVLQNDVFVSSAVTTSNGAYTFNLPIGLYELSAVYTNYQSTSTEGVTIAAGTPASVNFVLMKSTGIISGIVTSDGTEPMENVIVQVFVGTTTVAQMTTIDDGVFIFENIPVGSYDIVATLSLFAVNTKAAQVVNDNQTTTVNITMVYVGPGAAISGIICDGWTNLPLQGAAVNLRLPNKVLVGTSTTDSEGKYRIEAATGTYEISASFTEYITSTTAEIEIVSTSTVHNLTLTPEKGRIVGTIKDNATKLPIQGIVVKAIKDASIIASAITDANGAYTLVLSADTYDLLVQDSTGKYNPKTVYEQILTLNTPLTSDFLLNMYMTKPAVVHNNMISASGKKAKIFLNITKRSKVTVSVYNSIGELIKTVSDGEMLDDGTQLKEWDGTDSNGNAVGNGVYVIYIDIAGKREIRKMVIMK